MKTGKRETTSGGSSIRPFFLVGLILIFFGLIIVNPWGEDSSTVPTETSLRETVYVTALALNAEFEETGRHPTDLVDLGMDQEGLTYTRVGEGYSLAAEDDGVTIEYRSGEDLEPYRGAFEALLPPFREAP